MLKAVVELAAYGVAATLAAVCILAWAWKWGGWSWTAMSRQLRRSALAVMVAMAVVATMKAQKGNRGPGTTGEPPAPVQQTGTTGEPPVEDITDTFHFSAISVPTSGTVTLTTAWTNGLLVAGQTIDILVKTDLRDETWTWLTNGVVEAGTTNMSWTIENQSPSNSFYKAVVRDSLTDMGDPDGDGLPNVYERAYGRNPWVHDYALVQKRTVGPNGEFGDIVSALAASADYSIIAVTPGVYQVNNDIQMPPRPVMVTCEDGYAVFSGSSHLAMFLLGNGHQSGHTLFRNLYLNLTSTSGMQAGFWCGGGLPWAAPGAAAVFENVHIRAPNPGVEYFGWLFYSPCDAPAVIKGCCVNASGAEWIYAVFGDNPPPIMVESCTFVNFPTQSVYQSAAIGLRSTHGDGAITSTPPVALSRVLFDASFTNAWPLARFENAGAFPVTMTDCTRPSEPASSDFMPDVTNNVHIVTSQVAWAGFPLADSPAAALGIGAFAPIPSDSLDDTDHDTLLDYNEVYFRNLDPFLTDTDNDGTDDGDEIHDETDPSDPLSFRQRLTVTATNTASLAYPVRVAWGYSPAGWETNDLAEFPQGFGAKVYTNEALQVTRYARAFCDFNGNGEYDAYNDILLVRSIPHVGTVQIDFVFGDVDGDGLSDYDEIYSHHTNPLLRDTDGDGVRDNDEISEGTDPLNPHSFEQLQYVTVTNTASLAHSVYLAWGLSDTGWETNGLVTFPQGFGTNTYHDASMQGASHIKAFCDLNDNGEYDAEEDILIVSSISAGGTAQFNFIFGDVDGDGVDDVAERGAGSDPYSQLSLVVTREIKINNSDWRNNVTNHLWISTSSLTNDAILHVCATNSITTNVCDVATNGVLYAIIMRDLDKNGIYDEGVDVWMIRMFANGGSVFSVTIDDADGDGVYDSVELLHGTDPFDSTNFRFNTSAFFECMDRVPGLTNYVQVAIDDEGWSDAPGEAFIGCVSRKIPVSGITTSGGFYAKYFRDVNCNGVYDEGVDIFATRRFGPAANVAAGSGVLIGDRDSDGVPDSEELAAGTDPVDSLDYRFNLDLTVGGVFATSNNLTAVVLVDGLAVMPPCVVTGRSFACSLTNLYPHTGSGVVVRFWDDVNQNGVRDAGEKNADQGIVADGTNTVVYCRLPMGQFDADNDGMLDYWELQNGLSPQDPTDALADPDGDGLINLHEYMAGCNVWVSDGIGTALYAFCHAIDDRIRGFGKLPVEVYFDAQIGEDAKFGAKRNENCWAYGIDISGASPWNSSEWGLKAGTAISRRHIIFAHHYQIAPGNTIKFIGTDNTINIFTIVANKSLAGTDITIGLLSGDLPESVTPVSILSADYRQYLGDAKYVPRLLLDREEKAFISDSNALSYRTTDSDGLVPVDVDRSKYFKEVIVGDSGNPKFFVCGNTAIIACALHVFGTGASGRGPFVTYYRKRVQAVMDELCPGYTLRTFDLSTFRRLDDED